MFVGFVAELVLLAFLKILTVPHRQGACIEFANPRTRSGAHDLCGRLVVEIAAAIVGLFIAMSLGFAVFNDIPVTERDLGAYARAVIGALPFVVIAILEPTKILLASVFTARGGKPTGQFAVSCLGALTFVTFETMFNALIQQNSNITLESRRLVNEKFEVADRLDRVRATITGNRAETPQLIQERFTKVLSDLETERQSRIGEASREQKLLLDTINAQLGALEAQTPRRPIRPCATNCVSLMLKLTGRRSGRKPISPARSAIMRRRAASIRQRLIKLPMPAIHNWPMWRIYFSGAVS